MGKTARGGRSARKTSIGMPPMVMVVRGLIFLAAAAAVLRLGAYRSQLGVELYPIAVLVFVALTVIVVPLAALGGWLYERWQEPDDSRRPRGSARRAGTADAVRPAPVTGSSRARIAHPLPAGSRRFLRRHCDPYVRLPAAERLEFDRQVQVFVSTKQITGIGIEVTTRMRLLVAASAVTLTVGWPGFEWRRLSEVLLYPQDFDVDYRFDSPRWAGQAHQWGIVLLSVPSLRKSFAAPADGYHAGFHEFMHLLDVEGGEFDGIPAGFTLGHTAQWDRIRDRELKRLWQGRSILDSYALTNNVEFLAVAAEAFFEVPVRLQDGHRQLYDMLAAYFCQDPAAWEAARPRPIRTRARSA